MVRVIQTRNRRSHPAQPSLRKRNIELTDWDVERILLSFSWKLKADSGSTLQKPAVTPMVSI